MANVGGATSTCVAYISFTSRPAACGGWRRATSSPKVLFTCEVVIRFDTSGVKIFAVADAALEMLG